MFIEKRHRAVRGFAVPVLCKWRDGHYTCSREPLRTRLLSLITEACALSMLVVSLHHASLPSFPLDRVFIPPARPLPPSPNRTRLHRKRAGAGSPAPKTADARASPELLHSPHLTWLLLVADTAASCSSGAAYLLVRASARRDASRVIEDQSTRLACDR